MLNISAFWPYILITFSAIENAAICFPF